MRKQTMIDRLGPWFLPSFLIGMAAFALGFEWMALLPLTVAAICIFESIRKSQR